MNAQCQNNFFKHKVLVFVFLTACVTMASATTVGKVIASTGVVSAAGHPIKRGSDFSTGETIKTDKGASAQLRFSDGTLVALTENTEYRVDQYKNKEQNGDNQKVSTLVKGGLRSLTDAASGSGPNAYQVKTPVATIGIRGTLLSLRVAENGQSIAASASMGTVSIGDKVIGTGGDCCVQQNMGEPPVISNIPGPEATISVVADSPPVSTETTTAASKTVNETAKATSAVATAETSVVPIAVNNTSPASVWFFPNTNSLVGAAVKGNPNLSGAVAALSTIIAGNVNHAGGDLLQPGTYEDPIILASDGVYTGTLRASQVVTDPTRGGLATGVYWGEWSNTNCVGSGCAFANTNTIVDWIAGVQTSDDAMPRSGTINYNVPIFVAGSSNAAAGTLTASALGQNTVSVDFGEGTANTQLAVRDAGGNNYVSNAAAVDITSEGLIESLALTGNIRTDGGVLIDTFTGRLTGTLLGAKADYLTTNFGMAAATAGNNQVSGSMVLTH